MNSSGRTLAALGAAVLGLIGLLCLIVGVSGDATGRALAQVIVEGSAELRGRLLLSAAGVALLAADAALVLWAFGFGRSKVLEFESDSGAMAVDVTALEDCLRRTVLEDPDVADARATIRVPRGGFTRAIQCTLDVGIYERSNVPGKGEELAAVVRKRFLQIIPVEQDPAVNLRMRIRPPRTPGEASGAKEETPEPLPDVPEFTGERRYVVKDDEGGPESGDPHL